MRNGFAFPRECLEKDVIPKNKVETRFTSHQHRKKHDQKQEKNQTNRKTFTSKDGFDKADTR